MNTNLDPALHVKILEQRLGDATVASAHIDALLAQELMNGQVKDEKISMLEDENAALKAELAPDPEASEEAD